jgi:AraC-like DNA-binding protein
MLEARRLLYYTKLPIKEVAYEIGFDDIQAFSRFFRKHEGMPPSRFRELNRQG